MVETWMDEYQRLYQESCKAKNERLRLQTIHDKVHTKAYITKWADSRLSIQILKTSLQLLQRMPLRARMWITRSHVLSEVWKNTKSCYRVILELPGFRCNQLWHCHRVFGVWLTGIMVVWSQEARMPNMFWVVQEGRLNANKQERRWLLQQVLASEQIVFGLGVSTKTQVQKLTW